MKQQLTILTKTIKAIVIPNDILKQLDNPESFDLNLVDGKIVLEPIKKEKKASKPMIDTSMDLYNIN